MARLLNGTTDGMVGSGFSTAMSGTAFSCSCWINSSSTTAGGGFLITNSTATGTTGFYLRYFSTTQYAITDAGVGIITLSTAVVLNTWINVIVSVTAANQASVYFNGVLDAATPGGFAVDGPITTFGVGCFSAANNVLTGKIADAAFWVGAALAQGEATALARGARPYMIRPLQLKGYWPLDGLRSPEPDLSGNVNNLTLTGTALASGPPVAMFTPRQPQLIVGAAAAASSSIVFRRSLSSLGTRTGSRQAIQA